MSLFIYCPKKSEGAFELVKALGASRLRRFDGMDFWDKNLRLGVREGDVLVCWGATIPELDGIRVLNTLPSPHEAMKRAKLFANAGLNYIPTTTSYNELLMPRSKKYCGAKDLLDPKYFEDWSHAHFFTKKMNFIKEYRIHSFAGKSIRAGIKVPREGFRALQYDEEWKPEAGLVHPWVRNHDGGWRVETIKSTAKLRKVAHDAVKALGLTFGAVDIGETPEGYHYVIDVSTSPRLDTGTLGAYVKAINKWVEGGSNGTESGGNGSTAGEGTAEETDL